MNRAVFSGCRRGVWPLLLALFLSLSLFLIVVPAGAQPADTTPGLEQAVRPAPDPKQSFRVLCYHNVRDETTQAVRRDPYEIGVQDLIAHFSWLQANGYHPVSLQQIIDARAGASDLPERAVLLTFDDGYESVYSTVFPLLKLFNFPAVVSVVGSWLDTPPGQPVQYGDQTRDRDQFVTWDELRAMVSSGLVEVASHSYDLHKGIIANPQNSSLPAAVSHYYHAQDQSYESDAAFTERVSADLQRSVAVIERELQRGVRAVAWPYGRYNRDTVRLAAQAGMPVTMNLEPGPNTTADPLSRMKRTLIGADTQLPELIRFLHQPATHNGLSLPLERVIHVDLDYVYDADPVQQEANLSRLLDRIRRLHPSTVYLQAFADPDGSGVADALYFPNRHMPVRADLFSRVAWQLTERTGVTVYAWMPVLAFRLPASDPASARTVQLMPGAPAKASAQHDHRLSPFDPLALAAIREIYEDLGRSGIFDGILFHDDATLSDYEDASQVALQYYRDNWQLPDSVAAIRRSPALRLRWAQQKTAYLNALTVDLSNRLRVYQPALLTARNLYAEPVLNPESEEWFAQSLSGFLATYDFTAIMAMPYMEDAADPDAWLRQLRQRVGMIPGAMDKTVFELQGRDWKTGQPVPTETLAEQMRQMHLGGARNFGYYPDDFLNNQPEETLIKPVIFMETPNTPQNGTH